jgi:hypothetical protein
MRIYLHANKRTQTNARKRTHANERRLTGRAEQSRLVATVATPTDTRCNAARPRNTPRGKGLLRRSAPVVAAQKACVKERQRQRSGGSGFSARRSKGFRGKRRNGQSNQKARTLAHAMRTHAHRVRQQQTPHARQHPKPTPAKYTHASTRRLIHYTRGWPHRSYDGERRPRGARERAREREPVQRGNVATIIQSTLAGDWAPPRPWLSGDCVQCGASAGVLARPMQQ